MNKKQKITIIAGVCTIFIMGIFPPTYESFRGNIERSYGFLFDPNMRGHFDIPKLLLQWLIVGILFGGIFVVLKYKKTIDRKKANIDQLDSSEEDGAGSGSYLNHGTDIEKTIVNNNGENESGGIDPQIVKDNINKLDGLKLDTNIVKPPNKQSRWSTLGLGLAFIVVLIILFSTVGAVTVNLNIPNLAIILCLSLCMLLLHHYIINKNIRNLFKTNYGLYGFIVIIYAICSAYGTQNYKKAESAAQDYIQQTEFKNLYQSSIDNYMNAHPEVDSLDYQTLSTLSQELMKKSPKLHALATSMWTYKLVWHSSSYLLTIYIIVFFIQLVKYYVQWRALPKKQKPNEPDASSLSSSS